jgi:ABC-type transport system involved in multi-copper enzyme maturation permease subunit
MTCLPIVERELRVGARRGATYRTRFGSVLVSTVVCGMILWEFSQGTAPHSRMGQILFCNLSITAFFYCLLVGPLVTADCLSGEKREGTLGLLFLTDLKGYDVVMGKLVASSINSFYGLLGILPLLALPWLLGGITAADFVRMSLVLITTLLLSLAVGILVSTLSRHERRAMMMTLLSMAFLITGPYLILFLVALIQGKIINLDFLDSVLPGNPLYSFNSALAPFNSMPIRGGVPGFGGFWLSLLISHLMVWGALLAACAILPRAWQEKQRIRWIQRWRLYWEQWAYGKAAERIVFRRKLLEINPFLWLSGRDRVKLKFAWGLAAAMLLWGLLYHWFHWDLLSDAAMTTAVVFLAHLFFKIWIISEACNRIVQEQQLGSLEALLSTPMKVSEILRGQLLALKQLFAKPIVVLLLLQLWLFWQRNAPGSGDSLFYGKTGITLFLLTSGFVLLADLVTLSWVGMWRGLCAKDANRAILSAALQVLTMPWLVILFANGLFNLRFTALVVLWSLLSLLNDAVLWRRSRRKLLAEFRQRATFYLPSSKPGLCWLFTELTGSKRKPLTEARAGAVAG